MRLLPLTVRTAVPVFPDKVTVAVPSRALPFWNDTLPAGPMVPVTAFTVAASTVVVFGAIFAGVAVTVIVVAAGGVATVTVTVPFEPVKAALPA